MTKHYRRYSKKESFSDIVIEFLFYLCFFYSLYLLLLWFTNKAEFWRWSIYGVSAVILLLVFILVFIWLKEKLIQRKTEYLLTAVNKEGLEDHIKNFINRFGLEDGKKDGWAFRNHRFDWDRINDFKKILKEKGVSSKDNDFSILLRHYIQEKEEQLTRESIIKEPQKFANLSGSDFEKLLYRLFEAMGYKMELIGRSGDQGGDLIANRNGERTLIQAKCYQDWSTGNAAVQQVVGAMKLYNCNKAKVVTTSYFTKEAISLAKSNETELISKEQLQELLIKFLNENWY